jgi:hypothetical protein
LAISSATIFTRSGGRVRRAGGGAERTRGERTARGSTVNEAPVGSSHPPEQPLHRTLAARLHAAPALRPTRAARDRGATGPGAGTDAQALSASTHATRGTLGRPGRGERGRSRVGLEGDPRQPGSGALPREGGFSGLEHCGARCYGGCWAEATGEPEKCLELGGQMFKGSCYVPFIPPGRRTPSPSHPVQKP